jgi:hypothetical protein
LSNGTQPLFKGNTMSTKTDLAEAIVIERTLNTPVARVWSALTDVDQMRQLSTVKDNRL